MAANYIKGDELMLFYNGEALAAATSHQLTLNTDLIDIAHKDLGGNSASEAGKKSWEITTENLCTVSNSSNTSYIGDAFEKLWDVYDAGEPVTVAFARVSNYSTNGLTDFGGDVSYWTPTGTYRTGYAIISDLSVNANTGENATCSATFKGTGPFSKVTI